MIQSPTIIIIAVLNMITIASALANQNAQVHIPARQWVHIDSSSANIIGFKASGTNDKVVLSWVADNNQSVAQFEVERSLDSKPFVMAALVFGTDKAGADSYQFFEKKKENVSYRIRIIHKNGSINYSPVVTVLQSHR
jgi:hypothetical protein